MSTWKRANAWVALCCGLAVVCGLLPARAQEPAKDAPLVIVDAGGKEQKIKAWKFAAGTRHLAWLAAPNEKPAAVDPKDKPAPVKAPVKTVRAAVGPEALELREDQSTTYVDGILTLIPLDRIRVIDYDDAKQSVAVKLATGDKAESDEALTGTTKFRGINKITIEAEVDKGDLGIAEVKFLGGIAKGIRSLAFPKAQAAPAPTGRLATVTINDKEKHAQKVHDLQALYRLPDGTEKLLPTVMFKKTLKIDLAKVAKIHSVEGSKPDDAEWVVTLKDGEENTLSLLKTIPIGEQQGTLEGLLGKVPAGWKLYPAHTFTEIVFDEAKKE